MTIRNAYDEICTLIPDARKVGRNRVQFRCPNPEHPDNNPSCSLSRTREGVILHCFGCGKGGKELIQLLGLEPKHLFDDNWNSDSGDQNVRGGGAERKPLHERIEEAIDPYNEDKLSSLDRRCKSILDIPNESIEYENFFRFIGNYPSKLAHKFPFTLIYLYIKEQDGNDYKTA